MNSMQKSYRSFIESVCAEFDCTDAIRPLHEGFAALCEASGRKQLTSEKLVEFHKLVMETVKPIVSRINRFLKPCGLSIVLDYSDKAREHFEDEPHHVAAIMHSLQDEGSPVAPVAINEPMIAKYYYGTWHEDDYALEHCMSDSLWHETGHHIVDAANDILLTRDLPDDEDIVESFGRYMTEKTLGYDSDYDSEMVNTAIGAATLLKICNSGIYSKASLKKVMAFAGNEFTEQELAEWLQESGAQEKTNQAPGYNALQEGISALVESSATAKLVKYLNQPATYNVKASSRTNLSKPAYNYFTDAREVNGVWAVHFTTVEAFEDIQVSGFKNGTRTLDNLAYSTEYSDSKRGKLGWLFALPLDCPYLDNYDLGYGECGFLIKTNGVRARHIGDGDDEILFRGRDVLEKIPIIFDEDYDRWVAYLTDGKKLQNRSLKKLIQSAMKSLGHSELARPPKEGLSALCEADMGDTRNGSAWDTVEWIHVNHAADPRMDMDIKLDSLWATRQKDSATRQDVIGRFIEDAEDFNKWLATSEDGGAFITSALIKFKGEPDAISVDIPCPGWAGDLVSSSRNSLQESVGSPGSPEIPESFCPTTGVQAKVDAKLRQLGIVVDWSTYEPSRNRSWASQGMPSGTAVAYTVSEAEKAGSYTTYNERTICFYVSVSELARTPVEMYDVDTSMGSDYREIGVDTKFVPPEEPVGK